MVDENWLAERFEARRGHLRAVAFRVLGSVGEADHLVDAYLAAARAGDFATLLALLDPDAVLRADAAVVATSAQRELRGAEAVARTFSGCARVAQVALVESSPGLVWVPGGTPRVAFSFAFVRGRVIAIDMYAESARLSAVHHLTTESQWSGYGTTSTNPRRATE